jgi:chromosome segregation ATPase
MSPEAMEWLRIGISVISVAFAVYMGLRGNRQADSKEIESRIRSETKMDAKLDEVISTGRDTRDAVRELNKEIRQHSDRIVSVESSLDALTKRVEVVENRLNNGGA